MFNQFNRCIACFNFCLYFDIFTFIATTEDSLFDCGGMPAEIIGELGLVIEFQLLWWDARKSALCGSLTTPVTVNPIKDQSRIEEPGNILDARSWAE